MEGTYDALKAPAIKRAVRSYAIANNGWVPVNEEKAKPFDFVFLDEENQVIHFADIFINMSKKRSREAWVKYFEPRAVRWCAQHIDEDDDTDYKLSYDRVDVNTKDSDSDRVKIYWYQNTFN